MLKWCFRGDSNRSMEDSVAKGDLNCDDLVQDVSEKKNFSMWPRICFHDTLVKDIDIFCPFLDSQLETKVKKFRLMVLTGNFKRA